MSKASLLLGAPDFLGGMPLLKHLPIKISEFLHKNHGDKFLSLQLPGPGSQIGLRLQQIDLLFEKIEKFDKDGTVIVLHGGVMIGHKEYQGYQRVYACSFPHKKFRDFNHQDAVFMRSEGVYSATFHPAPDNVWYGDGTMVYACLYSHSLIAVMTMSDTG